MGKKKKIRRLVDAVGHLFATPPNRKKLKKAKAFERFLVQLRERRTELAAEVEAAGPEEAVEFGQDLDVLDVQIARAERLLLALLEKQAP
jgi:hypothetical protein